MIFIKPSIPANPNNKIYHSSNVNKNKVYQALKNQIPVHMYIIFIQVSKQCTFLKQIYDQIRLQKRSSIIPSSSKPFKKNISASSSFNKKKINYIIINKIIHHQDYLHQ